MQLNEQEVERISKARLNSFNVLNSNRLYAFEEDSGADYSCPYCGFTAPVHRWWTHDQRSYIQVHASMVIRDILLRDLAHGDVSGAGHSVGTYSTRHNIQAKREMSSLLLRRGRVRQRYVPTEPWVHHVMLIRRVGLGGR